MTNEAQKTNPFTSPAIEAAIVFDSDRRAVMVEFETEDGTEWIATADVIVTKTRAWSEYWGSVKSHIEIEWDFGDFTGHAYTEDGDERRMTEDEIDHLWDAFESEINTTIAHEL